MPGLMLRAGARHGPPPGHSVQSSGKNRYQSDGHTISRNELESQALERQV